VKAEPIVVEITADNTQAVKSIAFVRDEVRKATWDVRELNRQFAKLTGPTLLEVVLFSTIVFMLGNVFMFLSLMVWSKK